MPTKTYRYSLEGARPSKLSEALVNRLKQHQPDDFIEVILNLVEEPTERVMAMLKNAGLLISPFRQQFPCKQLPCTMTRDQLEKAAFPANLISQIDSVATSTPRFDLI